MCIRDRITLKYPESRKYFRRFVGSAEFIKGIERYCLWINNDEVEIAKTIPPINERLDKVEVFRLNSGRKQTFSTANLPHRFTEDRHIETESLIIPIVSSENRRYIIAGVLNSGEIIPNSARVIHNFEPYVFGVISSYMHILWVKAVGGKLKTDYRYSAQLCYNTFPFPDISVRQKENLNLYVFAILDERAKHPSKTMAQLYNPTTMPKGLLQAHQELDTAIEQCYRLQPFKNDTERLEYLFKQYDEMLKRDTLFAKQKKTLRQAQGKPKKTVKK